MVVEVEDELHLVPHGESDDEMTFLAEILRTVVADMDLFMLLDAQKTHWAFMAAMRLMNSQDKSMDTNV